MSTLVNSSRPTSGLTSIPEERRVFFPSPSKSEEIWSAIHAAQTRSDRVKAIAKFLNSFTQLHLSATVVISSRGATDYTLIGSGDNKCKFVLKASKPHLVRNAQFCSEFFRALNCYTPTINALTSPREEPDKVSSAAKAFFIKQAKKDRSPRAQSLLSRVKHDDPSVVFAFMKAFPGGNLEDALKFGVFAQLNEKCLELFWKIIGTIGVYDVATGNDDRFFRPSMEMYLGDLKKISYDEGFVNLGNLMLQTENTGKGKKKLTKVFMIDNGSFNRIAFCQSADDVEKELKKNLAVYSLIVDNAYSKENWKSFAEVLMKGLVKEGYPLFQGSPDETSSRLIKGIEWGLRILAENGIAAFKIAAKLSKTLDEEEVCTGPVTKMYDHAVSQLIEIAIKKAQEVCKDE